jgi:hypothetical protein
MPNDVLVNSILALNANATPSETVVLKIAAALIKQIDQDYDIRKDSDARIKVAMEEWIGFQVHRSVEWDPHSKGLGDTGACCRGQTGRLDGSELGVSPSE